MHAIVKPRAVRALPYIHPATVYALPYLAHWHRMMCATATFRRQYRRLAHRRRRAARDALRQERCDSSDEVRHRPSASALVIRDHGALKRAWLRTGPGGASNVRRGLGRARGRLRQHGRGASRRAEPFTDPVGPSIVRRELGHARGGLRRLGGGGRRLKELIALGVLSCGAQRVKALEELADAWADSVSRCGDRRAWTGPVR